ncbi:MAG: ACT domain-containing protein [Spirochaetia bacterium]|jgi:glycine cleavage system transcriptional repressor
MATGFVVLTAVGTDRVGIVDDIAGAVSAAGCNIEESKMAVLGGEFAVIMLVSGPAASVDSMTRSLPALGEKLGLRVGCHPTHEPHPEQKGRPYLLKAVSLDTPGIVHSVTAVLRRHEVNIEDLETETAAAPWTGAPMFRLSAHLVLGPSVSIGSLKQELAHLQQQLDLEIVLKPVFGVDERQ